MSAVASGSMLGGDDSDDEPQVQLGAADAADAGAAAAPSAGPKTIRVGAAKAERGKVTVTVGGRAANAKPAVDDDDDDVQLVGGQPLRA